MSLFKRWYMESKGRYCKDCANCIETKGKLVTFHECRATECSDLDPVDGKRINQRYLSCQLAWGTYECRFEEA